MTAPSKRDLARLAGPAALAVVLVAVAAVRLRTLHVPLERDEGEYAYAGQLLLQGIPPYRLAYNMKFPGTYAAYALVMAVFGETPAGIHAGALVATLLTALLVYLLGRRLGGEACGVVAGASAAFLAASPSLCGLAAHATQFAALGVAAGTLFLWDARERVGTGRIFAAGLAFGLAVLMKQQAAVFPLWALWEVVRGKRGGRRGKDGVVLAAGVTAPLALTGLALGAAGVFASFWHWTISYAWAYVSEVPLSEAPAKLAAGLGYLVQSNAPLWALAAAGLVVVAIEPRFASRRASLAGFAAASALSTVPGFYFRVHYFLLMVPAAALLAGCAVAAAWSRPRLRVAVALAFAGLLVACAYGNRGPWLEQSPVEAARALYGVNPFPEAEIVAGYLRRHAAPDDTVAVLGSEPEIYFLAHRRSATGHIYTYALMEPQPYAHAMQEQMISDIEAAAPPWVVFVRVTASWLPRKASDRTILRWWNGSYRKNYELAGLVEILPHGKTRVAWDGPSTRATDPDSNALLVFHRRTVSYP